MSDNLIKVYRTLQNEGYELPKYEEFETDMRDDKLLGEVRQTLVNAGYTPPAFDEFKFDMWGTTPAPTDKSLYTFTSEQLGLEPEEDDMRSMTVERQTSMPTPMWGTISAGENRREPVKDLGSASSGQGGISEYIEMLSGVKSEGQEKAEEQMRIAKERAARGERNWHPYGDTKKPLIESPDIRIGAADNVGLSAFGTPSFNAEMYADDAVRRAEEGLKPADGWTEATKRAQADIANKNRQAQIKKAAEDAVGEMREKIKNLTEANTVRRFDPAFGEEISFNFERAPLTAADLILAQTEKMVEDFAANREMGGWANLGRSAATTVFDPKTWDIGLSDMLVADQLLSVVEKADKGEKLSESEQLLLDAAINQQVMQAYYGELSGWQKAGKMFGESLPFMAQIAVNPLASLGKYASSKAAKAVVKHIAKKVGEKGVKKILAKTAGITGRALGDLAGSYGVALTSNLGNTTADALNRQIGDIQYDFDDNGVARYNGRLNVKEAGEAWLDAANNQAFEFYSEQMGNYFAPILKGMGKLGGKALKNFGMDGVNRWVSDFAKKGSVRQLNQFFDKTQFHGFASEYAEEIANGMLNAAFVGDMTMEDVFSKDNLIDTAIGLSVMGAIGPMVGTAGYARAKYKEKQALNAADESGRKLMGHAWDYFADAVRRSKNGEELSANLRETLNSFGRKALPGEDMRQILSYAQAYNRYKAVEEVSAAAVAEGVMDERDLELQRQYENGQTTTDKHGLRVTFEAAADAVEGIIPLNIGEYTAYDIADEYDEQGDADTATAIRVFLSARAAHSGMTAQIREQAQSELDSANAEIDSRTNKTDGNIYSVTLGGGLNGYVTGGTLITDSDGDIDIDATREANEGGYIYVNVDGVVKPKSVDDFVSLDGVESAADAKAAREAEINAALNAQYEELTAPVETQEATPASTEVAPESAAPAETTAALVNNTPIVSNEVAENAARALGVLPEELEEVILDEQEGLERAARYNNIGDTDSADAIRAYVAERFGTPAVQPTQENNATAAEVNLGEANGGENIPTEQAPEAPALSPEQQRKAKRAEIAARIPTKGKNKLWTQAKAEDVAEYIATLTDDAAVQQATADKYIADIKEKQAKMDAIEALELNDDIAFWERVKGLLAPVETQAEEGATAQAPEVIPAAENEMQPVAEVTEQPLSEVQSEEAGEPVGNSEQLNQSGDNTEMGAHLTNEASKEEHPTVKAANEGRDTVGGSPVALAYLLEGGQGSILNAGYFLHGVAAAFPAVSNEIEALRSAISKDVLGMNPTDFAAQRAEEIAQIGELITNVYGEAGAAIYNELLNNASGFVPRVGAEVGARIEALQPVNSSTNPLQNENNNLNLQQENVSDNESNQNDTPVGGQVSESVPQGEHGTNSSQVGGAQEAAARLRERIESAQRNSKSGLREIENRVTREFAQENGLWIENEFKLGTPFPSGDEHNNYIDTENQVIYKVNNRMHTPSILDLLDRIELHNKSFPNTQYRLVGFTAVSKNGDVMPVFAQDFVPDARMADIDEIDGYMGTLGFTRVGDGRYSNGETVIKDLKPRNVLADADGDIYVVDAEFEQEKTQTAPSSGENTQNGGEKDVIEETREQNRVAEEREQRAGLPPRLSDYSTAIANGNVEAIRAWEEKFDAYLQALTNDDLPAFEGTIRDMQERKSEIKAGNPKGYKENPNYKAFDYIEKALKKRKRELEKSSTTGEKRQDVEDSSTNSGEQSAPTISQESEQVGEQVEKNLSWEEMSAQERMNYASKNPLTIDEIKNSTSDEVNKSNAIAYISGTENLITQLSYLKVYEDVRIRPTDSPSDNGDRNETQLVETNSGESGNRGAGGESGNIPLSVSETGSGKTPSIANVGENSEGGSDSLSGERGDSDVRAEESSMDGIPAGNNNSAGSRRGGRNGSNGRRTGRRNSSENIARGGEITPQSNAELIDDELNNALSSFKDTLSEFVKAGKDTLSISLTGLNGKQLEILPKLISEGTKIGYILVKKGLNKLAQWSKAMKSYIGQPLSNAGLSDAEVDAFIDELWNSRFPIGDEVHTIGEWASIIGMEETRKAVRASISDKKAAQDAAESVNVKIADAENIAETLPFLLPQQQDDVLKAETQFFDRSHNDREHAFGKGYMFTNGTGTGKTYTGLGIVKRFIKQGKGRILIVTPSQQKVTDWISDAKNLNISLRSLDEFAKQNGTTATQTAGEGAVITTYANFRENAALLEGVFDLVVYDESHRLLENKTGTETRGVQQHYMITNRDEDAAFMRLREINPVYKKIREAQEKFISIYEKEIENKSQKNVPRLHTPLSEDYRTNFPKLYKAKEAYNKAEQAWGKEELKLREQAKKDAAVTKVVFLSATPFNTRDNLDYAERYIFMYPKENTENIGSYRYQSPKTRFYLEHFGGAYKFRYGRLENAPQNADVIARQEVAFSDYLQNTLNTMSGRVIDSEYDYSRDFPTVSLEMGPRINSAIDSITEIEELRPLWSARNKVWRDYNYSSALFETMKVSAMLPRLKQHLEKGRKIVIFHRRTDTKEPIIPPFKLMMSIAEKELKETQKEDERKKLASAIRKFKKDNADLFEWEQTLNYSMPREQLAEAFGKDNVLFFSGKESAKVKNEAVKLFNDDNSGKNIIVIQEASGKEGISLHDRTGKHQRVVITLALPQSPITALQIEGRIYRIGNKSNAIFEYPILGLNSEIVLFGQNFNNSVSTTENLALGSKARSLRSSFARGIEERSGDISVDEQGIGGKEADANTVTENDPFDNAVLDYYTNQKITTRRDDREGIDYYPTPEPLGFMMNIWGRVKDSDDILEPSAGHGAIARYVPMENALTAVEPSQSLFARLQIKAGGAAGRSFVNDVFENYNIINKHDVILMNPPFGVQGKLASEHVAKAYKHLNEGGRIVAIVPEGKAQSRIEKWLGEQKDAVVVGEVLLPDVTFVQAGTSIRCRVLVIDKISNEAKRNNAATQKITHNLGYVESIDEFFDTLRNINMPDRTIDTQLIMEKKVRRYASDLRGIKGVKEVYVNPESVVVRTKGWRNFNIVWGDLSGNALKKSLAQQYSQFAKKIPYADETSQEVMKELQGIICKLANMTEDEMERFIANPMQEDDTLYRSDNEVPRLTKHRVEKIFGGIWIDDAEEFAKFASAVNNSPFEEDGEGIAFTDNYFYAYYLNIDGQVIPFASVYLNSLESQEVVNQVNQEIKDGRKEKGAKEYFDTAVERYERLNSQNYADNGNNSSASNRGNNVRLGNYLLQKGRYYDRPSLYVKTQRADRFGLLDEYSREGAGPITDREVVMESDPYSKVLGKPRHYGKRQREFAARQRERVESLAKNLHLDNVEVVTDSNRLQGNKRNAKGFYTKSTGKITIVIPNHSSTFDVEQTLLHEAVAHYGLRQLFGDRFDTFLDNVFKNADVSIRKRIIELAQKKNWDLRTATEEYLASLAEETNFENTSASWWRQIKELFLNMLHKIGFEDFGGVTLSDNELRYILWRSYENLAEPGKFRSILGEVSDIAKQYELGVGNYAQNSTDASTAAENNDLFRDGDPEIHERALARDRYERLITKGLYQAQEAQQDSMLALEKAMLMIDSKTKYVEDIPAFENAYLGENALSSVNQNEVKVFHRFTFKPLLDEVAKLARNEAEREELTDYMMAKHGLERNRVMAERDARAYVDSEVNKLKKELKRKGITEKETEAINKKINLLKAKLDGVAKNFSEHDARIWYDTRKKSIDNLLKNGEIDKTEYNKKMARLNTIFKEGYIGLNRGKDYAGLTALTGMDNVADAEAEAQRMVDDYEQAHETDDLWEKVNAVSKAILQKSYECGMMSKETFDKVSNMYEFYIPLRGFDEKTSSEAYAYLTHKDSAFNAPIKTAKGRKSKADNPLVYLESMAESAIMQGNRNRLIKQRFFNFVLNHPSDLVSISDLWVGYDDVADEWKPVFPDNINSSDTPEEVEKKMQDFEAKMEALAQQNPDQYKKGKDAAGIPYRVVESRDMREHQIIVKRGGRDYVLTVNGNPRLAQAVNGLTNPDNDLGGTARMVVDVFSYLTRSLSAIYTTLRPDFIAGNLGRDIFYSNSIVWIKESPNYAWSFNLNYLKVFGTKSIKRLLAKYRKGTLDMNNETESMFDLFMKNGGETGYHRMLDIDTKRKELDRKLKAISASIPFAELIEGFIENLGEFGRAVELQSRFAAFITSRKFGRSVGRAIWDAKEISVNFNKKGSGDRMFGSNGQTFLGNLAAGTSWYGRTFIAFYNAAIQGTFGNFGKYAIRNPKKTLAAISSLFSLGFLIAALGAGDDDDEKENYYNLPEYTRRNNICIKLLGNTYSKYPLPIEFRSVYGLGELCGSAIFHKEEVDVHDVLVQVSQIMPIDMMAGQTEDDFSVKRALTPTLLKTYYEAEENRSWTGLPIWKDTPFNKNLPGYTKAYRNANKHLVNLSEALNAADGKGDTHTRGKYDFNPAKVEYILKGYTGGFFDVPDQINKMWETAMGERDFDWRNVPLMNRFFITTDERTEYRAVNNEYYRLKEERDETMRRLRAYEKDADNGILDYLEKIDFLYNSPEYERALIFDSYYKDGFGIRDYDKALKEETDDEIIEELVKEQNELKRELIKAVKNTYNK